MLFLSHDDIRDTAIEAIKSTHCDMMREAALEDEVFCLRYELRLLSGWLLEGKLERWVDGFSPPTTQREHLQRYTFVCGFTRGKRVLDLACGTGRGARLLAQEGAAGEVVGCDIDNDSIRYAKIRNGDAKVSFRTEDGLHYGAPAKFDIIVCFETVEHVNDPGRLLDNFAVSLRDGGRLFISTPVAGNGDHDPKPKNPYHVQEWGWRSFQEFVSSRFIVEQVYVQYYPLLSPRLVARAVRKLSRALRLASSDRENPFSRDPLFSEWSRAGLSADGAGSRWSGYQILICSLRS